MNFSKKFRKLASAVLAAAMVTTGASGLSLTSPTTALAATSRQVEALNRGLVAVKVSNGVYLSWRLLGTESYNTTFNVYRNGTKIASVTDSTNYVDTSGSTSNKYTVRTVVNGSETSESDSVSVLSNNYKDIPIQKPSDTTLNGKTVTYSANDASVADVDGDGEYEIILKWNPSNAKDNSQSGYTSNVYIDAYEMDGTRLWRIDLGKNIRAGAHYTQFIAYDLNGDGKAEIGMKTADGTVAGDGTVIGDKSKDYRNSKGYILSGPEYYTLFEGATGKVLTTIDYIPQRGTVSSWGDSYGNRVDRFLAGVGYLNGQTPYLIIARGYYTRTVIVAYRYKSGTLARQWTFDTNSSSNRGKGYDGQGNHSLSIADVDGDGNDEIIYGSLVVDDNGSALNCTGLGHGDALHVSDFDPSISGLEIFQVHEEYPNAAGTQMRKASSGSQIWGIKATADIGRGVVANMSAKHKYYIAWSSQGMYDKNGNSIDNSGGTGNISPNFAIWWDADLYRELLDGNKINKWSDDINGLKRIATFSGVSSVNGTKNNPSLQADIFGDWKEEVMYPLSDSSALRIMISTSVSTNKLYTWMHDTQYRCAVAWQNVGYNQPPHPSFYVGPDMSTPSQPSVYTVGSYKENTVTAVSTPTPTPAATAAPTAAEITEGVYYLKNVNSGLYLDIANGQSTDGANVQQYTYNGSSAQKFKIVSAGNGYYKLLTGCSDYAQAVDVSGKKTADGTNILTWTSGSGTNQQFKFVAADDGSYGILTRITGDASALDVANMSTTKGANVQQYSYWGGAGQRWYLEPAYADITEGVYNLKNVNSGLYLDIANGQSTDGANVQQYTYNGATAQQFKIVSAGNGYYKLLTGCSNYAQAVDVSGKKTADGTNILTWTSGSGTNQQFKFFEAADGSYGVLTRITNCKSALDVANMSTTKGANVQQYSYWGGAGQRWYLEPVSTSSSSSLSTSSSSSTTKGTNKDWNMGSSSFSGLGTISSSTTVDGLTLVATSAKTMKVSTSGALTVNGASYSTFLALGGSGSTSYRAMKFDVTGPCTIKVVSKSSGSSDRTLAVSNGSSVLGTISAPTSLAEGTYSYTGSAGTIYIYSQNSGINVYDVSVTY